MANWGPAPIDFSQIANLGTTFSNAFDRSEKRARDQEQRQALASLGQTLTSDNPNYLGAAQRAFAAGDANTGLTLLKLGEQAKITRQEQEASQSFGKLFGGGSAAPASPAGPQAQGAAPTASAGEPNEIENRFVGTVRSAGLTNPIGLAAVAAYGRAESGFSPKNANRTWNDPSESGQPGQAGGIMSWRADRLQNLYRFAQGRGEQPGNVSPETQAMFLAQEDPQLLPRLNAARSPEEANQIMANAWRFAGFDRPGGENARRLALTKHYASRFGQGQSGGAQVAAPIPVQSGGPIGAPGQPAPMQAPQPPAQMAQAPQPQGQPMADAPAQGAAPAQGFAVPQGAAPDIPPGDHAPQVSTRNLLGWMAANPKAPQAQRDMVKSILERRQRYVDDGGGMKTQQMRLQNEKLQRELQGEGATPLSDEERKAIGIPADQPAYKTRSGEIKFGPAGTKIINEAQKGATKFEEELGKSQAKRWDGYIAEGDVAQGRLADIQQLRQASRNLGSQGSSANLKAVIGPYAESLGIQIDGLSDIQIYESVTQRLAPQLRAPGSGSTSDIEFKGFLRAIGPLSNTPAAREMILDTYEAASRNDIARAEIATRLATGEISRGQAERELRSLPNPMEAFKKFREANPDLVGEAIKAGAKREAAEKREPVKVTSPDEARKLPRGTRIILPDGRQGQVK